MANQSPRTQNSSDTPSGVNDPNALRGVETSPESHFRDLERVVLEDDRIRRSLMRISHEVLESNSDVESLYIVAIPNGGVPLGRLLVENIESLAQVRPGMGILDTTLYRDDLAIRGTRPRLRKTEMPSTVDDRIVILVEDVVNTGRTIRAAMDALMDFGRPRAVKVVALVDRGHRELPIKIDYVGKNIPTQSGETVVLHVDESPPEMDSGEPLLKVVVRSVGEASGTDEASSVLRRRE